MSSQQFQAWDHSQYILIIGRIVADIGKVDRQIYVCSNIIQIIKNTTTRVTWQTVVNSFSFKAQWLMLIRKEVYNKTKNMDMIH